jgi:hypothetical protein
MAESQKRKPGVVARWREKRRDRRARRRAGATDRLYRAHKEGDDVLSTGGYKWKR